MPPRCLRALLLFVLFACITSQITANVSPEKAQDSLRVRQADIQQCAPIQQLSALKAGIEENESPLMRQVFAWLFPFGPAWNSRMWIDHSFDD
jgi:solute carrier family 39 (zinc transporter), member 7